MVCYYRHSCLDLPVALFDFHMGGCALCLYHVCQENYVAMHDINLDRAEQNIFCNCVDELLMGGKAEKLKKVVHSTV